MNKGITKRVLQHSVDLIAAVLKVPRFALKLFRLADEMSGLEQKTIPKELIPLNAIQLARGLLNYTALQSLPGWVFPRWAERQFDPADPAFIPRSHMGLSINVTGRNWTAVGSPSCPIEPVVDVCGAVMAFRNRWSIDVWLKNAGGVAFPSRQSTVYQELVDGLPIVRTSFDFGGLRITETTYVASSTLCIDVSVENLSRRRQEFQLAFALRPFNPEGVAPVHEIRYDTEEKAFLVDKEETICLGETPDEVHCSNRAEGDSAKSFEGRRASSFRLAVSCPAGLANAYAAYSCSLDAGGRVSRSATVPLSRKESGQTGGVGKADSVRDTWMALLDRGAGIVTPDEKLNTAFRNSLCTLLLLIDGDEITPGPWTYHQFWFRDAAYMLRALDLFGYHDQVEKIIRSFPRRLDRRGYFRSQQGEWDSNGQALWTICQHAELTGDARIARDLFPAMWRGAQWIGRKRLTGAKYEGRPYAGLMPAGLSAEHLGLCDYYFWDNWWSAAGLQSFVRVARRLGKSNEAKSAERLLHEYRACIEKAIRSVQESKHLAEIPAGPLRGVDSGMIGSCAAWYPLQELPPDDTAMLKTVCSLNERFVQKGLFFQDFIHSGGNPYLTLQLAQAWLYAGRREEFWRLFTQVLKVASPTLNYPEAIHPQTGGGSMGDGHHGWAAAEVAMALRSALVQEYRGPGDIAPKLVFLGGIPAAWCAPGKKLVANRLPVPGGVVSLVLKTSTVGSTLDIDYCQKAGNGEEEWTVKFPVSSACVMVDGGTVSPCSGPGGETVVRVPAKGGKTRIVFG